MKTRKLLINTLRAALAVALCASGSLARAQYAYSNAIMALNPILYYPLNDSTPVPDDGFVNAGTAGTLGYMFDEWSVTYAPAHQSVSGPIVAETNQAPLYNGTANYSCIPYALKLDPSSVGGIPSNHYAPFTIEAWLNPGVSQPTTTCVLSLGQFAAPRTGWLMYQNGNSWEWRIYDGTNTAGTPAATLDSGSNPTPGTWDQVAMVWDGTNASLYVDGVLTAGPVAVPTFAPVNYAVTKSGNFITGATIGERGDITQSGTGTSFPWNGAAAEVAFYTNALLQSTLLSHYQNGTNGESVPGSYETLVLASKPLLFYVMNDPSLTTLGTAQSVFTTNYGSLGTANNGIYEPGTSVVPGIGYPGFGTNHAAVNVSGIGYLSNPYTNSGIQIPPMQGVVTNGFTFTCWVYERTPTQYGNNYFWQRGSGDVGLWDNNHFNPPQQLSTIWSGAPTNTTLADYAVVWPTYLLPATNAWNFVAAVWTPTNVTVYVNGVASLWSNSASGTGTSIHYPRDFSVGTLWLASDPGNTGIVAPVLMDEVAMFAGSLTPAQLQSLVNASGVLEIPYVTQSPLPTNYEGQTITLTASVLAATNNQYGQFWIDNGVRLTGQTNTTLVLSDVHTNNSGSYAFVITNSLMSVTSTPLVVTIVAGPPIITAQPTNQLRYAGPTSTATFGVAVSGSVPYSYQWSLTTASTTNAISGATNSTYTVAPVQSGSAGSYSVVISNPHGSVTSSVAVLTVAPTPADYASLVMADGPECYWPLIETSGLTANDYASGLNGTLIGGNITVNAAGPAFAGLSSTNKAYQFGGANTVAAYVGTTLQGIKGNVGTFIALVNPSSSQVVLPQAPQIAVARNSSDVFALEFEPQTGSAGAMEYVWANSAYTYNFQTAFCPPATQWSFVAVTVAPGAGVIYLDSGSGLEAETNILDQGVMGVSGGAGPMELGGDPAYTGTSTRNYGGLMSQVAYFNRTLSTGEIQALDQMLFQGSVAPIITAEPVAQIAYAGMPITLSVDAAGGTPLTYQWQLNGTNIAGATGQTYTITNPYYTAAGSYTVVVSGSVGPSASSTPVEVTVLPPPSFVNLTNGLVLHLKFDGDVLDYSGHTNNGTTNGAPTFIPGIVGSGAIHVSSDVTDSLYNYVALTNNSDYPNDFEFTPTNDFSVAFWVRFSGGTNNASYPNDIPMIGNELESTYDPGWVMTTDDGRAEIGLVDVYGVGSTVNPIWNSPIISDSNWHHFAMSVSRSNQVANAYVDGLLVYTCAMQGYYTETGTEGLQTGVQPLQSIGDMTTGYPLTVGQDPSGSYHGNNGSGGQYDLDDMGMWQRALSATDIQGIYLVGLNYGTSFDTYGPEMMNVELDGTNVDIIWQAGTLESAPALTGPWTAVAGAAAPFYQAPKTGTGTFFRVKM